MISIYYSIYVKQWLFHLFYTMSNWIICWIGDKSLMRLWKNRHSIYILFLQFYLKVSIYCICSITFIISTCYVPSNIFYCMNSIWFNTKSFSIFDNNIWNSIAHRKQSWSQGNRIRMIILRTRRKHSMKSIPPILSSLFIYVDQAI